MPRTRRGDKHPLRPSTKILTEGFDPTLSLGSARPAVFRSSTYVFSSPEAAEHAFNVTSGRTRLPEGEGPDLIYSRFNHPNAQMLEDQIVNLDKGSQAVLAVNCGVAAIVTSLVALLRPRQAVVYTVPIVGGTQHFIQDYLSQWGITDTPVFSDDAGRISRAIAS